VIANLNKETRTLLVQQKFTEALASADRSLAHTVSADAVYQKSAALIRLGMFPEAIAFMEGQLKDSVAAPSFLTLKLSLGDALWGVDSLESAMKAYSDLLRSHLSSGWDETVALRLEILLNPGLARELKSHFLTVSEDSSRVHSLEKLAMQHPKEPILKYLLAREKVAKEQYEDAIQLLDGMPPWRTPVLELARQRRLGQLSFAIGKYEKAKIYYWQSLNHLYRDVHGVEIEERIRLCDWMESFRTRFN
jgi:tetratricopeptide (TPR) repeat protein